MATRTTSGHENALAERQRITDNSFRICIMAGQM